MKVRIATGIISALLAIIVLVFVGLGYRGVISVPMGILSAIAVYETTRVIKCKNKALTICATVFSALFPLYVDFDLGQSTSVPPSAIIIIYVMVLLLITLKNYDEVRFEQTATTAFASTAIPGALSALFKVREMSLEYPQYFQRSQCVFLILCAMYGAWMSDSWAYFVGIRYGKHKLAPKISPKKTVEGFAAGIFGGALFCAISFFICDRFFFNNDSLRFWTVLLGGVVLSVLGTCGDLSASVIKRNFGKKDFGNLFPGHGGVLDRIDSFLFTMPALYVMLRLGVAIAEYKA